MSGHLEEIVDLLSCPDDGQRLKLIKGDLCCSECGRHFPIYAENFVEVLPNTVTPLNSSITEEYRTDYFNLFYQKVECGDESGIAWGATEAATSPWIRKRQRQVKAVYHLLTEGADIRNLTLCDFAAGAGHYTCAYSKLFSRILHCDLSPQNLNYSRRRAREARLDNVFFLRIDYFRPPFKRCLDRIICLDTIIRGGAHDQMLLNAISGALSHDGKAVIDFHNWWHNPLRRLGLLKQNFFFNKSYSRKEAESLLAGAGITDYEYRPFYQEFDQHRALEQLCAYLLPPTRMMYCIGSPVKKSPDAFDKCPTREGTLYHSF